MDTREPLHVLLTSAGRRGYLVDSFRQALGEGGRVFAADASDDAPALWIADVSFRLPPFTDPCYLDHLLALCERHRVKLLVPLNDYELPLIAAHRQRFLAVGTIPHVSTPEVVASCLDKWQTYRFLCDTGLPTPPTYVSVAEARAALEEGVIDFPLVIKPRWGSGSQGIELARDERELDLILELAGRRAAQAEVVASCLDKWQTYHFPCDTGLPTPPTYVSVAEARAALEEGVIDFPLVIKPRWGSGSQGIELARDERELDLILGLAGRRAAQVSDDRPSPSRPTLLIQEWQKGEEHALNVINDLEGAHVATLAMRKLGMRAGETDRAVTVADPRLASLGQRIGAALRHVGNLDVDIIVAGDRSWILDLNPRFGGSYPFAHAAGANLPAALLAWAQGLTPNPQDLRLTPGIASAKLPTITAKPQPNDRPITQ